MNQLINKNPTEQFYISTNTDTILRMVVDQVYSMKELAVLRELSTNAYDAHVAAGIKDTPFEVHLPTSDQPRLVVRDFGPGLSKEEIVSVYIGIGVSTKANCVDTIGHKGIGAKSPFAISETFMTISRHNGTKLVYLNSFLPGQNPTSTLILEEPTTERSGLEVIVPTTNEYVRFAWNHMAAELFSAFTTHPLITGGGTQVKNHASAFSVAWNIIPGVHAYLHNTYKSQPYGKSQLQIRVGQLCYKIDTGALSGSADWTSLLASSIIVDAPMDAVTIPPSREGLTYDTKTVKFLTDTLSTLTERLCEEASFSVRTEETVFGKITKLSAIDKAFPGVVKLKNDLYRESAQIFAASITADFEQYFLDAHPQFKEYSRGLDIGNVLNTHNDVKMYLLRGPSAQRQVTANIENLIVPWSCNITVVHADGKNPTLQKVSAYAKKLSLNNGYVFLLGHHKGKSKAYHEKRLNSFLAGFLGKPVRVIPYSTIDKSVEIKRSVGKKASQVRVFCYRTNRPITVDYNPDIHNYFLTGTGQLTRTDIGNLLSRIDYATNKLGVRVTLGNLVLLKSEEDAVKKDLYASKDLKKVLAPLLSNLVINDGRDTCIFNSVLNETGCTRLRIGSYKELITKILQFSPIAMASYIAINADSDVEKITVTGYNEIARLVDAPLSTVFEYGTVVSNGDPEGSKLADEILAIKELFPLFSHLQALYYHDEEYVSDISDYIDSQVLLKNLRNRWVSDK